MSGAGVGHFEDAVAQMPALLDALRSAAKHRVADHPAVPNTPGIYLFSDADKPIYVGQSRKLRTRLRQHTGATNRQNQASFAFNLAKREALADKVDVKRPRADLELAAAFVPHFDKARAAVAAMDVQSRPHLVLPHPMSEERAGRRRRGRTDCRCDDRWSGFLDARTGQSIVRP